MEPIEALERCYAILQEQAKLLCDGNVDSISDLEREKASLLKEIDWAALGQDQQAVELARALLADQQAFEHQCSMARDGLLKQTAELRKQQKALVSYLENR